MVGWLVLSQLHVCRYSHLRSRRVVNCRNSKMRWYGTGISFRGALTLVVIVTLFVLQSDNRILRISDRHACRLRLLIVAVWCIQQCLLLGSHLAAVRGPPSSFVLRSAALLLPFTLMGVVYMRYRLLGVLAIHLSGIMIYLIFQAICVTANFAVLGEPAFVARDTGVFLVLAAYSGLLVSTVYALIYITYRRSGRGRKAGHPKEKR